MKFLIKGDKGPVEVSSTLALVEYLNSTAKWPSVNPASYMLEYAKRSVIDRNIDIRATDPDSFIQDLIKHGDLQRLD